MSSETESPADELRYLVGALREQLAWQDACGAHGLPKARRLPSAQEVPPAESVDPHASTMAPDRPASVRREAMPAGPEQAGKQEPRPRPVPGKVRVEPPEQRAKQLEVLQQEASGCTRCPLHKGRCNVVYGAGPVDVEIMIVGEGPGAEEDAQGEPFVGKAGKLLDKMLTAMGFDRSQVYIGNIVKCRPPENRTPDVDEMRACFPYLQQQIELVRPKVIIAMGSTAVRGLLGVSGVTRIRGRWKLYDADIPVMPTFHPAYLLRNEGAKRDVWNDLKAVLKYLKREIPKRS